MIKSIASHFRHGKVKHGKLTSTHLSLRSAAFNALGIASTMETYCRRMKRCHSMAIRLRYTTFPSLKEKHFIIVLMRRGFFVYPTLLQSTPMFTRFHMIYLNYCICSLRNNAQNNNIEFCNHFSRPLIVVTH